METSYTAFGSVLDEFLKDRGMSEERFAREMSANGYSHGLTQQEVNKLKRNVQRVYPEFFVCAQRALNLSDQEMARWLWAYGPGSA